MAKRSLFLLLSLVLLLTSCSQAVQQEPTITSTTEAIVQESTPMPPTRLARCVTKSSQSTPEPTVQALLPQIGEDDWTLGSEEAGVKIVEYGDFQ
jgi:PBP1b-binding outer membrane lipoprotein LpoB